MEILKYRKDVNSEWQTIAAIQGAPGEKGEQGIQGPKGEPGASYVLTEADKQEIASMVEVPGGGGVEEVYTGTTAPTDENIKIWINPEEELEFATVAYVDEAVAGAGGGSGNSYVFDGDLATRSFTAADKAKFAEVYNGYITNGKLIEYDLWIRVSTSANYEQITRIEYVSGINPPRMYFYTANKEGLIVTFNASTGAYSGSQYTTFGNSVKDWYWSEGLYGTGSYSHIKVVGYFDTNTSDITSFDISTSNNNYFNEEGGTFYHHVWSYQGEVNTIVFYNNWGDVQVSEFCSNEGHAFTPLGYWYWG